ncbi:MAG: hypothetical protein JW751_13635 [Polyangiaceae bacterium]|nr:hypothetical protein [Polyangiaceae bacterium]
MRGLAENNAVSDRRPALRRAQRPRDRVRRVHAAAPARVRLAMDLGADSRRGSRVARRDSRRALASPTSRRHPGNPLPLRRKAPGLGLGARDYDPTTGRWTAKEPDGVGVKHLNLYVYVNNDPGNRIDVDGFGPVDPKCAQQVRESCQLHCWGICSNLCVELCADMGTNWFCRDDGPDCEAQYAMDLASCHRAEEQVPGCSMLRGGDAEEDRMRTRSSIAASTRMELKCPNVTTGCAVFLG